MAKAKITISGKNLHSLGILENTLVMCVEKVLEILHLFLLDVSYDYKRNEVKSKVN